MVTDAPVSGIEAIVHQAVGMTMEYLDCSDFAALEVLRRLSEQRGEHLLGVALDVLHRQIKPTLGP